MRPETRPKSNTIKLATLAGILVMAATTASAQTVGSNGIIYVGDHVVKQSIASSAFVSQVSAGNDHVVALKYDGSVVAWGYDNWGQCEVPKGLYGVKQVSAAGDYTLLLKADGTVVAFGYGLYGQTKVPVGLNNVKQIAAGTFSAIALKNDGTVVVWGDNGYGQQVVPSLGPVIQVAAGEAHFVALQANGKVVCWGNTNNGGASTPANLGSAKSISANYDRSGAILTNGTVVCWGGNPSDNAVPAGLTNVVQLAIGPTHTLALKSDHSIVSWGTNYNGEVATNPYAPGAMFVAAGARTSFAVDQNSQIDGWGESTYGQTIAPWEITDNSGGGITKIAAGYNHLIFRTSFAGGVTRSWGCNLNGQCNPNLWFYDDISGGINHSALTNSTNGWNGAFNAFSGDNSWGQCTPPSPINSYDHLWAVGNSTYGHLKTGGVQSWGENYFNALNLPKGNNYLQITGGDTFAIGLLPNGTVIGAGTNTNHQLDIPAGITNVVQIASGKNHNVALGFFGAVQAWGSDGSGESDVPPGLNGIIQVGAGATYSAALRSDGSVHAWGQISYDQPKLPTGLPSIGQIASGTQFLAMLPSMTSSVYPAINLAGDKITGTIVLAQPAPAGGTVVKLSSNVASAVPPATVTVPAGQRQVSYAIQTTDPVAMVSYETITATLGADSQDALLTLSPAPFKFTLNKTSLVGDSSDTFGGTVTLLNPAPAGGASVAIKTSDPAVLGGPTSVLIPAGQKIGSFYYGPARVHAPDPITVTLTYMGTTRTQSATIMPFTVTAASFTQPKVLSGAKATFNVTLNAVPTHPVHISIMTSDPNVENNLPEFDISGAASGSETFVTTQLATVGSVWISGWVDGTYGHALLTLQPALTNVLMPTGTLYGNQLYYAIENIALPAPAGGFNVNLSATGATTIPVVQFGSGTSALGVPITMNDVSVPTLLTLTASVGPNKVVGVGMIQPNSPANLTASPQIFKGSSTTLVTGTVYLKSAVAVDTKVTMVSSNPAAATVPPIVTVKAGASSAQFLIGHSNVATSVTVTITATHAGGSVPLQILVQH